MTAVFLLPLLLDRTRRGSSRWWEWALVAVLAISAALSLTLTGYVALGMLGVVYLIARRSMRVLVSIAAIGAVAVSAAWYTGLDERVARKAEQIQEGDWYWLFSARHDGWIAAAQLIRTHPILGVGTANYTYLSYPARLEWLEARSSTGRRGELATHFDLVHCDPLQVVVELGTVGVVWLVALLWALRRVGARAPTLTVLAGAATLPFLILHYPTHLGVGLASISLVLAELSSAEPRAEIRVPRSPARLTMTLGLAAAMTAACVWQIRRLALDRFRADIHRHLVAIQTSIDPQQRARKASMIEDLVMRRITEAPSASPWLWREVGKAHLVGGDPAAAAAAFSTAYELWPHEEPEFGLGLALAAQNRRNEALFHLARVCRVNPRLIAEIADADLRRSVTVLIDSRNPQ
jgi:hypothetical protein